MKLCTVCGVATSGAGSRCSKHPRLSGIGANHQVHADPRWARLSKRVIARHVGQHGYTCPGYQRDPHPARDLTTDHVVPLAAGGAPFDIGNCTVLCRSCNSTKGASEGDRGTHTRVLRSPKTFGLLNMQQRAEAIGAILDVRRWPAGGTHVALEWRAR